MSVENACEEASSSTDAGNIEFSCEFCGDQFSSQTTKRRHEKKFHPDELDHSCPDCGKAFHGRTGLVSHHAQIHDGRLSGYDKVCGVCGSEFTSSKKDMKYCSPKCGSEAQKKRVTLECERCESEFETTPSVAENRRFCSIGCKGDWFSEHFSGENHPRWKDNTTEKECAYCGSLCEIFDFDLEQRDHNRAYCSVECAYRWRSENIRGENHPLYIDSEVACETCGNTFQKRPAKVDAHDKQFCSRSCHGKWLTENNTGENNPRWVGGHVEYGKKWYAARRKALERDNHTCQDCGKHADELERNPHVHHIKPVRTFDNVDNAHELNNLVVLCGSCHPKWEGLYLRPDTRGVYNE